MQITAIKGRVITSSKPSTFEGWREYGRRNRSAYVTALAKSMKVSYEKAAASLKARTEIENKPIFA